MAGSKRFTQNPDGTFSRNVSGGDAVESGDYDDLTKDELAEELESRGLAKSGSKAELIARLEESDAG